MAHHVPLLRTSLLRKRSLANAISTIIAGALTSHSGVAADAGIEEVIVTARKREENLQDIPQAITAFTSEDIARYQVKTLEDYARFVPSLTTVGSAPGQTKIVFRGVADSRAPFIADPTAAIYLDEQPLTTGSQSPEVFPVDIERVEALQGPQATLYGASSQSGTMRILTNRPDASAFAANAGASAHTIDGGGDGYDIDATVNLPLIQDRLAVRFSGFSARDAGYIDNVLGPNKLRPEISNADAVEKNHNDVTWLGGRLQAKWWVNDEWTVNGLVNYQRNNANGFNDFNPAVGDLEQVNFFPESYDDEWYQTSLVIEGDLGFAKLLSATSYFERDTAYVRDYSTYAAWIHVAYGESLSYVGYNVYYSVYDFNSTIGANDATALTFASADQKDKRLTQEIRLTHDGSRWDWTLGFFYQDAKQRWDYDIITPGWRNTVAARGRAAQFGALAPTDSRWNSGERSERTDLSVFGEVTFAATESINLIFGGRWYDVSIDRKYHQRQPSTAPLVTSTPSGSDSGFLPKGSIQYKFNDDAMVYVIYSEGFRTGGINRGRGMPVLPNQYDSDKLINYEGGLKSQWWEQRLQVNITGYHQVWKNMQLETTDPANSLFDGEIFQTVIANIGDAAIDGMDVEVTAAPIEGLDLYASANYLFRNEVTDGNIVFDQFGRTDEPIPILPDGVAQLPLVAQFNFSAYIDYTWQLPVWNGAAFTRFQYSYTGDSLNSIDDDGEPFPQLVQKDYHTGDISAGLTFDSWEFALHIDNVWDERAEYFRDTGTADRLFGGDNILTSQPRTFGVRFRKFFR